LHAVILDESPVNRCGLPALDRIGEQLQQLADAQPGFLRRLIVSESCSTASHTIMKTVKASSA